jgi:glycerol-3-phosphate cytidylyltransferase
MTSRVGYTGGTFDLFHAGHVHFLRQCKQIVGEFGEVVVSVNTDEFIEEYKGKPPVISLKHRMEVLLSCVYVDRVVVNTHGADSKKTISMLYPRPNFIIIGDDWARKDYYAQMNFTQEWLDKEGIVLIYVPYMKGISSTEIKERL